jgi:hypothetical protein
MEVLASIILVGLPKKYEDWIMANIDQKNAAKLLKELEQTDQFIQGEMVLNLRMINQNKRRGFHCKGEKVCVTTVELMDIWPVLSSYDGPSMQETSSQGTSC